MSCSGEIKELLEDARKSRDSDFKDGFVAALEEALEIVEGHEEEDRDA